MTICRWVKKGVIPGARQSQGGHYFFTQCPALDAWVRDKQHKKKMRVLRRTSRPTAASVRADAGTALDTFDDKILMLRIWLATQPQVPPGEQLDFLKIPKCYFAKDGATFDLDITFSEWSTAGLKITGVLELLSWIVADWFIFGAVAFGVKTSPNFGAFNALIRHLKSNGKWSKVREAARVRLFGVSYDWDALRKYRDAMVSCWEAVSPPSPSQPAQS